MVVVPDAQVVVPPPSWLRVLAGTEDPPVLPPVHRFEGDGPRYGAGKPEARDLSCCGPGYAGTQSQCESGHRNQHGRTRHQ